MNATIQDILECFASIMNLGHAPGEGAQRSFLNLIAKTFLSPAARDEIRKQVQPVLNAPIPEQRIAAVRILAELAKKGDKEALRLLQQCEKEDKSISVRMICTSLLSQVQV
jgi:N-acetylglucosamine kinase-like BadF-type ATPase